MSERDETNATAPRMVLLPAPPSPEEMRDFNARWLLDLMDELRPNALRLVGRSDPAAAQNVARCAGLLSQCARALAGSAANADQLTLESPRTHKTAHAGR